MEKAAVSGPSVTVLKETQSLVLTPQACRGPPDSHLRELLGSDDMTDLAMNILRSSITDSVVVIKINGLMATIYGIHMKKSCRRAEFMILFSKTELCLLVSVSTK